MNKLDKTNELFRQLELNPPNWWNILISDKDIYIDIRKENYIDIYYNGGGLLKELKYTDKGLKGNTNYKYLLTEKSESINFSFEHNRLSISNASVDLLQFKDLDKGTLNRIKANISKYYPASSEKGIQARFIRNAGSFIDSEFAYNYVNKNNENIKLRIDLVWIDVKNKKILFVELKTMGDSRLYTNEIHDQLKKYNDFAISFEKDIIVYYQKVFEIKKKLNILPKGLTSVSSLKDFTLEKKPLLLFGDCSKKWINNNANDINEKIKKVAIGAYYFGDTIYNCDLIGKTQDRNRYMF